MMRLKFAFTGGTDDPAIDLTQISPPSPTDQIYSSTITSRFSAFPTSNSDIVFNGRKVEELAPEQQVDSPVCADSLGPTSFTDVLYDLCLGTYLEDGGTACLRISWEPKRMVPYGLSPGTQAKPDSFELARMVCEIAEQKAQRSKGQKFTVELLDNLGLRYRYRYLIACKVNP
jgi:hypothetical protein